MDLTVTDGAKVNLNMNNPRDYAKFLKYIRPKTALALKELMFINEPLKSIDVQDSKKFETLNKPNKLISLLPKNSKVSDLNYSSLRGVISTLHSDSNIPEKIEIPRRKRVFVQQNSLPTRSPLGRMPIGLQGDWLRPHRIWRIGPTIDKKEITLPKWLQNLEVFMPYFEFDAIRVGHNAELVLEDIVVWLRASSLYLRPTARVVQTAELAIVNLRNNLVGNWV